MDKLKEYIELFMDKFGEHKKVIIIGMVILGIIVIAGLTKADSISLDSGQVVSIPDGGSYCEYDSMHCPNGWSADGSFPFEKWRDAILERLNEFEPPPLPECGGLVLGGPPVFPCYEVHYDL